MNSEQVGQYIDRIRLIKKGVSDAEAVKDLEELLSDLRIDLLVTKDSERRQQAIHDNYNRPRNIRKVLR